MSQPKTYREAMGLPPYVPEDLDNRSSVYGIIVEILGWIITISVIFLFGMFLNWYFYQRYERVDRVFPEDLPPVAEEVIEEVEPEDSIDTKAKSDYEYQPLPIFEIQSVNYYSRFDELTVVLERTEELYFELFDRESDERKKIDHKRKYADLVKLRAFESQAATFETIAAFLNQITLKESQLGAKLLDAPTSIRLKQCIQACSRMQVEAQVLLEYKEEFKINQRQQELEDAAKEEKFTGTRKRVEMQQNEKLFISYLVSLKHILKASEDSFKKLKILSTEDQLRITAQFTLNNYLSYLLTKYIKPFKETRPTLLESLIVLRKKYKLWPATVKYHSLETTQTDDPDEVTTPIVACLAQQDSLDKESDLLKNELLKMNKLFNLMELVERRFRIAQVQIADDWNQAEEDDPKVELLRDVAFNAFKTYCNTAMKIKGESVKASILDVTGQPDEFIKFAASNKEPSRLEQILQQKRVESGKVLGPMMNEFLEDLEPKKEVQTLKQQISNTRQQAQLAADSSIAQIRQNTGLRQGVMAQSMRQNQLPEKSPEVFSNRGGARPNPGNYEMVKPRYENQLLPDTYDPTGNQFSKMVQNFSNLADPDGPRLLRNSVPASMLHQGKYDNSMPHSLQAHARLVNAGSSVMQNPPLVRPVLLEQIMDSGVAYKVDFQRQNSKGEFDY